MNNLKIIFVFVLLAIVLNCKTVKESVKITQIEVKQPVLLKKMMDSEKTLSINIPIKFNIYNSSLKEKCFYGIEYLFEEGKHRRVRILVENKKKKLIKLSSSKEKCISPYEEQDFVVYTPNFYIDTIQLMQSNLKPYLDKMKFYKNDTISLGLFKEFKKKHFELIKGLFDKDSIQINFINGYGRDIETEVLAKNGKETRKIEGQTIDYEFIKIPVKW